MNPHKTILLAVVLLAITVPLARAQGTYTQFDVTSSLATQAYSINTAGAITGYYDDASGFRHGFVRVAG